MLEKIVEIGDLLEIYGDLLTLKQLDIMRAYYEEDLSMIEIGENMRISRQAVNDSLKKSEKQLLSFDEKLGLYDYYKHNTDFLLGLKAFITELKHSDTNRFTPKEIDAMDEILGKIQEALR